jgi:hypothetical protein
MDSHRELIAAIESFDHWGRPWEFYPSVSSVLSSGAREDLARIWAAATEATIWSSCEDLAHGSSVAEARLSLDYPWLSVGARRQLVNGAAYQWR